MAILTPEQKTLYLESHGGVCPFCHSSDISGGSVDIEANIAWQEVTCQEPECGETWQDVYTLTSVETQDELQENQQKRRSG
jgi:hypothetical protein